MDLYLVPSLCVSLAAQVQPKNAHILLCPEKKQDRPKAEEYAHKQHDIYLHKETNVFIKISNFLGPTTYSDKGKKALCTFKQIWKDSLRETIAEAEKSCIQFL